MRKLVMIVLGTVAMLAVATVAFAANEKLDSAGLSLLYLGASIGMAIAAAGCGIGQGLGLKGACEGTARNPEASGKIMVNMILGLAFIESLAIYALVVNLMIL